jgi:hypothetical protein
VSAGKGTAAVVGDAGAVGALGAVVGVPVDG